MIFNVQIKNQNMKLKDVNIEEVSELISVHKHDITCIECCKYYSVPSTAICGHSLCHSCWRCRSVCPFCGHNIDRRTLMLNLPLQCRTENVKNVIREFEEVFNIKYDNAINLLVEDESNKNVDTWLTNCENDFSTSDIQYQESVSKHQDSLCLTEPEPTLLVQQITSKIQIHSKTKKASPKDIICVPVQQDDWDKIEEMTEIETNCNKPKENLDLRNKSFGVLNDENSLLSCNNIDNAKIIDEKPVKKNSTKPKPTKTCFKKIAKNFNNTHKINEEFNKLAKKYRNKNISINQCDNPRIQTLFELDDDISSNKNVEYNSQYKKPVETEIMDENDTEVPLTPVNVVHKLITSCKELTKANNTNKNSIEMEIGDENDGEIPSIPANINNKQLITPSKKLTNINNTNKNIVTLQISEKESIISVEPDNNQLNSKQTYKHIKQPNVSFFQKGSLNNYKSTIVKTTENDSIQNYLTKISSNDNDEIEITIKSGTILTNICINKKENDIKLKINSEKQIQTCLNNITMENKTTSCSLDIHNNILSMNNNIVNNSDDTLKNKDNVQLNLKKLEVIEKSTPSKKGTASADTISVQNEITESIEAELINSQNDRFSTHTQIASQSLNTPNNPKKDEVFIKNNTQLSHLISKPKPNEVIVKNNTQMLENIAEVESINIFNSEPVEETNASIQSLKCTKKIQDPQNSQFGTDTQVASQLLNKPNELMSSDELIKNNTQHISKVCRNIAEDIQSLNSIFESEPIEETNIECLKSTKKTPSTILTLKSNISKSHRDKRNRDSTDLKDFPTNKKRKLQKENEHSGHLESNSQLKYKKNKTIKEITVLETDSESLNYEKLSQLLDNESKKNKSIPKINLVKNKMDTTNVDNKCSENIFSISKESPDADVLMTENFKTYDENIKSQANKLNEELEITKKLNKSIEEGNQLSPVNDLEVIEISTPVHDDDSDKSVVEDTPQKAQSFTKNKKTIHIQNTQQLTTSVSKPGSRNIDTKDGSHIINLSDTESTIRTHNNLTVIERNRETLDTPLTITQFAGQITHKSTPVARKSLNFNKFKDGDPEPTPGSSSFVAAKSTQEKEFLCKAFDTSFDCQSQVPKKVIFYVAGSCLTGPEQAKLKLLCSQRHWVYVDRYSKELTHLVVGVDEENKSQRSVKYMCALAGAKWIISYDWVEKCLQTKSTVDEEAFEVLDGTGEPGPRRSRLSKHKIFEGITFFCMPPFSVLDIDTLKDMLRAAGGRVVDAPAAVRVRDARPALLLAEPEHTEQDKFIYLAMKLDVVPVNYEWVLNCLGSYTLGSIHELLLCSSTLLPKATEEWPSDLMSRDFN